MDDIISDSFIVPLYYFSELTSTTLQLLIYYIKRRFWINFSFLFSMNDEKYRLVSNDPEKLFYTTW